MFLTNLTALSGGSPSPVVDTMKTTGAVSVSKLYWKNVWIKYKLIKHTYNNSLEISLEMFADPIVCNCALECTRAKIISKVTFSLLSKQLSSAKSPCVSASSATPSAMAWA